jgi:hypothetical protein
MDVFIFFTFDTIRHLKDETHKTKFIYMVNKQQTVPLNLIISSAFCLFIHSTLTKAKWLKRKVKQEISQGEDSQADLLLNGVNNTRPSSRIAKRKPPIINNIRLPIQQVKVEEDTDTKPLLQSLSNSSKLKKGQKISQEQINQLIRYIVNDNTSTYTAARKVKIAYSTGWYYYNEFKKDPNKKVPLPRIQNMQTARFYTRKHIENLIRHINDDKMSIAEASARVDMTYESGKYYYAKCQKDPDHAIHIPRLQQHYTQDQTHRLYYQGQDDGKGSFEKGQE